MPTIIESIVLGINRRRAQRALRELDDHLLRDIGLTRDEVRKLGPRESAFSLMMR